MPQEYLPMALTRFSLSKNVVEGMNPERRSALAGLGVFINETNWLLKLLTKATVLHPSSEPELGANVALITMLVTLIAGKIHEGWARIRMQPIASVIKTVTLPTSLRETSARLEQSLAQGSLVHRIRNAAGFHYPTNFDFALRSEVSDAELSVWVTGKRGDTFSNISVSAAVEPFIALKPANNWKESVQSVYEEVMDIGGLYLDFLTGLLDLLIQDMNPKRMEFQAQAPVFGQDSPHFFTHPPVRNS